MEDIELDNQSLNNGEENSDEWPIDENEEK